MNDVLIRRVKDPERDMHKDDDRVKIEAETGVRQVQAKESQGLLATLKVKRQAQNRLSSRTLREYDPTYTLILDFSPPGL